MFWLIFWKDTQQIAVMKIQRPKACDFLCVFEVTPQSGTAYLAPGSGSGRSLYQCQYPLSDTVIGIVLTKVSFQTHKTLPYPVAARKYPSPTLDLIATLSEVIEKLALGHGLADHLVDLGANQAPPCGAALLLGPPFAVLFGLSALRIFNDRKVILPRHRASEAFCIS